MQDVRYNVKKERVRKTQFRPLIIMQKYLTGIVSEVIVISLINS